MPSGEADLQVVLSWRQSKEQFDVSLAYDDPSDPYDVRNLVRDPIGIDTEALALLVDDEPAYGAALSRMVFTSPESQAFYAQARAVVEKADVPLHLRLVVDPRAPRRFHALRWESLRDPMDGSPIATKPNVLFSRYLTSGDWSKVTPPPRHQLRALAVVADPSDLHRYTPSGRVLHPVDVDQELARARDALAGMQITELAGNGTATLNRIMEALEHDIDVVYLVCHGALTVDEPRLFLEEPDGTTALVDGSLICARIAELSHRPTLAVLCSCQSAGDADAASTSDEGALSALGPRLAAAGVAAVLAMQGNVTMRTAGRFVTEFFRKLTVDGVVDRAAAAARSTVRDEPDWWVPVLFSRLRSGRTYYQPEFGERGSYAFTSLISSIKARKCTPVLGSGMANPLLPSREDIARSWARRWQMPLTQHARGDLAKVAQYLRVQTAREVPSTELRQFMLEEFHDRWGAELPDDLFKPERLAELIREVADRNRAQNGADSYQMVAELELPVYVTTSWTSLLEDALVKAGREPIVRSFPWERDREVEEPLDFDPDDLDHPLVYHLYGRVDDFQSIVLSEDDYFTWLTAWIRDNHLIPDAVKAALTSRSLLFLGYRLDDWEFRALFRGIKSFPGAWQLIRHPHVGVQLSPDENIDIEPEAAKDYLESSFTAGVVDLNLSIYWGKSQQFLQDLHARMRGPS